MIVFVKPFLSFIQLISKVPRVGSKTRSCVFPNPLKNNLLLKINAGISPFHIVRVC